MTLLLVIIGLILIGVSARLFIRAAVLPRLKLRVHLQEIRDYGFDSPVIKPEIDHSKRLKRALTTFATRLGRFMTKRVPSLSPLSASELSAAGLYDLQPDTVHGYRAIAAICLPTLILLLLLASGPVSMLGMLLVVISAVGGWILPSFFIRKRGAARLQEIDRHLPELIDLLIAMVEAGMGFAGALAVVADRFHGAIGAELKLTMKRQSLGMTIGEALEEMGQRCNTTSVRAFVRTAGRGESLGVSIGPVLRELSIDQRRRQRQSAREKMQKAPVKMIFPLMFLIFPALMIVIMFPAAYSVAHNLSGVF